MPTAWSYGMAFSYERGTPAMKTKEDLGDLLHVAEFEGLSPVQGYLAHKKQPPLRTLQ